MSRHPTHNNGRIAKRAIAFKRREPGSMTDAEKAYAAMLAADESVDQFYFERLKLRLADLTYYSPDFMVIKVNGEIEFHEVKASRFAPNQDMSRVKIKVAAEQNHWAMFVTVEVKRRPKKDGGGWFISHTEQL